MTDALRGPVERVAVTGGAMHGRRQFLLGGVMMAAAAAGISLRPRATAAALQDGALDRAIPERIGDYRFETASGLVLPPQDEISQRIYDQVLTRVYAGAGGAVMLLIAYGSAQDSGLALHRPEICYPAAGYAVTPVRTVPLAGMPAGAGTANFLSADRSGQAEQVLYWTRIGVAFPTDNLHEKIAVARANLGGTLPDGVLVRISAAGPPGQDVLPTLVDFNRQLIGSLGGEGRRLLLGTA